MISFIPERQLAQNSVQIGVPEKRFSDWSSKDHGESFDLMQKIVTAWKTAGITSQYMIYGKVESKDFFWEVVPYQKSHSFIDRALRQILVLWRVVFGGIRNDGANRKKQLENLDFLLRKSVTTFPSESEIRGTDPFCKEDTIERQYVLTGKKVNVLFSYTPIGFGGERLHFLVMPKSHREGFSDLTKEEYVESMELTERLTEHFGKTRNVDSVYLFNKTGEDAGQTVKHWHLHVVFCTNTAQDLFGKLTVLKNILFGSKPMGKKELTEKVHGFRAELSG